MELKVQAPPKAEPAEPAEQITIRVATEADWDQMYQVVSTAFHEDADDGSSPLERSVVELDRTLVAQRAGDVVGTATILTRQLRVPGAMVPTGHVTLVSVAPTSRRLGILTRFLHRQFDDMRAAGEPIAALWASEGRIYQRYGYGLAARRLALTVESREIEFLGVGAANGRPRSDAPAGRLVEGTPPDLREAICSIYDQALAERVGWSQRAARHWDYRLADPTFWRRGGSPMRAAVHHSENGPDGYALWRVNATWQPSGPAGDVKVIEVVANSTAAHRALWQFLLTMDLTRTVDAWNCALDEPLQYLVGEPRRLGARLADSLWLRLVDLPAALAARRYATPVDVVLDVRDPVLPLNEGRWRLVGSPESATCTRSDAPADLSCDVRTLASAYLGDQRLTALARAGLIEEHRPGALAAASTAFGWHLAPSSIEAF